MSDVFKVWRYMMRKSQPPKFGIRKSLSPLVGLWARLGFTAGVSGDEKRLRKTAVNARDSISRIDPVHNRIIERLLLRV